MSYVRSDRSAPDARTEVYELELSAVQGQTDAASSSLVSLLDLILQKPISRQQVQALLEQAYARLETLREDNALLAGNTSASEILEPIERAGQALQVGDCLSLTDADAAYEKAFRLCASQPDLGTMAAEVRVQQARIAAASLNFRHAAALYAEAAAATGDTDSQVQYLSQQASMLQDLGREFLDIEALQAAVEIYENKILNLVSKKKQADRWAQVQDQLGATLGLLGQRQRGTRMLDNAVAAFHHALGVRDRDHSPLDWATTQNNLGNALGALGQRQRDPALLEQSVAAFESALEVRDRERTPQDWATTQNNLAAVLQTLGQLKQDAKILKPAVDAYKAVLTIWTRERRPLVWGMTMNNLGTALRLLGEQRKGPRTLEQAVAAYNAALSVRLRERVPHDWAMTQNNLGAALQALGERTDDALALGRSIAAYRETLKQWTREFEPMSWAMTLANLGVARRKLAERNEDIDLSRRSADDLKLAVDVFRGASHAQLTELGEEQLALSRKLIATLEIEQTSQV